MTKSIQTSKAHKTINVRDDLKQANPRKNNKFFPTKIQKKNKSLLTRLSITEESFAPEMNARTSFTVRGGALDPSTVFTLTLLNFYKMAQFKLI